MFIKDLKPFFGQLLSVTAALTFVIRAGAAELPADPSRQFQAPPRAAQPWVYWVWYDVEIPNAAITRDLEAMKAKGIAGCIIYGNQSGAWVWHGDTVLTNQEYRVQLKADEFKHSYVTPVPGKLRAAWSPSWRQEVCFAAGEAARLGIDLVVCDGLANTSGDLPEEYGEQKLVWTETPVHGGQKCDLTLPDAKISPLRGNFPHPKWTGYHRDVAVLAIPDEAGFSADRVINLTSQMDAAGHLHWNAPAGNWKVLRFVQVPTGVHNAWGYFNDSLSTEAQDRQWAVTMAPLLKEMTPQERRGLEGIEDDSWEAGKTTWTKLFPKEFKRRRGYDLIPYLPILAGINMGDADTRTRIQRDYNLTISDLIVDNHYQYLNQLAQDNGLVCHSEAAGPNYAQADLLKTSSRVADAMAEFWMPSEHRPSMDSRFLLRNAANANHVYGKKITMCESFTSLGPEWEETPFAMKPVADQAFCDGLNKICVHNFSQSPSLTAKPGYVYVAGTHYEPGVTWWDESPAFNQYLARCSALLQAGLFVADAIFYHGDNIGHGEQRKTILPTLGEGYDHDNCNSEVLLTRMRVRDGRIVLPDGMSYRVLALPESQPMPLADLKKVADLAAAGATIVGPPPTGLAGMPLHPGDETKFSALTNRLWGGLDGASRTRKPIGAGQVVWGRTVRQVLQDQGVPPDFAATGMSDTGTIDWIHRQMGDAEIYFVASRWETPEKITATFRVAGKQPELWDPVTGEMRAAGAFHQENGCTEVPLEFGPYGSIFVVFRKSISPDATGGVASNYPATRPLTTLSGPWTVNFDPKWGGPEKIIFDQLMDWTNSPDPGIQHYSGTAIYHQEFVMPAQPPGDSRLWLKSDSRLWLDLGEVDVIASVRLNGHDLGVVWTKPARVDVTGAVKAGTNDLEITVVNLWPNRLIYDESLPKEQRLTETNVHKFGPSSPLLPSGLIGPVRLLAEAAGPK
jgi:hypothetical protein